MKGKKRIIVLIRNKIGGKLYIWKVGVLFKGILERKFIGLRVEREEWRSLE